MKPLTLANRRITDDFDFMNESLKQAIRVHPFFEGMRPEHLDIIASDAKSAKFEAGQMLFHEGEPANQFYLIQSGRITLEAHELAGETVKVLDLGPSEVLGWSWLVPPFTWHLQARALEPTQVIALNGALTGPRKVDWFQS